MHSPPFSPFLRSTRFIEIDALRGVAVLVMIIFHFLFDYNFFIHPLVDLSQGFWFGVGRLTASVFVGLAGLSLTLHAHRKSHDSKNEWLGHVRRGELILGLGMIISQLTYLKFPASLIASALT